MRVKAKENDVWSEQERDSALGSSAYVFAGISTNTLLLRYTVLLNLKTTEGPISPCLQIRARFHFSYLSSILFCFQ